MIEVCLFKSLRVIVNGRTVENLTPQEQILVIGLAMEARKPLTHDQICRILRDADYSDTMDSGYRPLVSRTRKKLGDKDHTLIVTVNGGYLFAIDPGDVDILRFQTGCKAGWSAADAGDWTRALGHLKPARETWTGEPYFYSRFPHLRAKYEDTLNEHLTGMLPRHAEAVIRIMPPGASDSVLSDLKALLRKDRSNDRLCRLNMLALYRSGNPGKATEFYVRTERHLADRYGRSPSRGLQDLYKLMISEDESERLLQTPLALPPFSS